jgi:signal transduction histidine kinase
LVEDSEDDAELLLRELARADFDVRHQRVETDATLRAALDNGPWDLVISDHSMPGFNGSQAFAVLQELNAGIPFIFVSGTLGEEPAVEAMRLGVSDYFVKGKLSRLAPAIRRELGKMDDRRQRQEAENALEQVEHQLQQVQKMEALGRLAGGVAHDFNNLLTVIIGHLDLIREGGVLKGDDSESLDEIQACAQRATGLTRQLLAFSRRQESQRRAVDLNATVAEVGKMLQRIIGEDLDLSIQMQPGLPAVLADPGQLQQVLMNLAVNARDAMAVGGRLQVETALVQLAAEDLAGSEGALPGPYVMLALTDSGHGMDAEVLSHIFEPFFTTKAEGRGTGLGLAMVYGIVKQSGGHLSVTSEPGHGSQFKVYLPALRAATLSAAQAPSPGAAASSLRGSETVLLVEDEQGVRELLRRVLQGQGYQVLEAAGPEEALLLVEQSGAGIDLLLTDVTMPHMDGRELAQRVVARYPQIKVLHMTGYAHSDVQQSIENEGARFIYKPFTPHKLSERLREILDRPKA